MALSIAVDPLEESQISLAGVEDIAPAKAKLDELFLTWLSKPETQALVAGFVEDLHAGRPVELPVSSANPAVRAGRAGALLSPSRGGPVKTPPRSPTRALDTSPTSPQFFTFEEPPAGSPQQEGIAGAYPRRRDGSPVQAPLDGEAEVSSLSEPSPPAHGRRLSSGSETVGFSPTLSSSLSSSSSAASGGGAVAGLRSPPAPSPVRPGGATYDEVPPFFKPGAGGRGRGRPLAGESLEAKLPFILDIWRKHHAEAQQALAASGGPAAAAAAAAVQAKATRVARDDGVVILSGVEVSEADSWLGLPVEQFAAVSKTLCGFPSFFAAPLFRRMREQFPATTPEEEAMDAELSELFKGYDADTRGVVWLRAFLRFWREEMECFDNVDRFFRLLAKRTPLPSGPAANQRAIVAADLMPFLEELLAFHPGLAFLETAPEFQEKYARTVAARIFYVLDPFASGVILPRELRRSNLLSAFHTVDMEEDINLVNDYFSYEHFYVLYCKFWELDADHDFLLAREDLNRLQDLNHAVLDRVFAGAGRRITSGVPGKFGFEDFVCFLLSEEDKTNPTSLRYWFRVVDLDGDGVIRKHEMFHFYRQQFQRMQELGMEAVKFEDLVTQMSDLLQPAVPGEFRIHDFLHPARCKLTGVFFSALFNLTKFQSFEARDPVVVKQELNMQGVTHWDRFASVEYMRLAEEEENGQHATSAGAAAATTNVSAASSASMGMSAGTGGDVARNLSGDFGAGGGGRGGGGGGGRGVTLDLDFDDADSGGGGGGFRRSV